MNNRLNKYKYPGAHRLMLEAMELKDKTEDYCAQPIDDNLVSIQNANFVIYTNKIKFYMDEDHFV